MTNIHFASSTRNVRDGGENRTSSTVAEVNIIRSGAVVSRKATAVIPPPGAHAVVVGEVCRDGMTHVVVRRFDRCSLALLYVVVAKCIRPAECCGRGVPQTFALSTANYSAPLAGR